MRDNAPTTECSLATQQCRRQSEIAELKQQLATLQQQVITDPMTQLFNKRHFLESLETELERSRRSLQPTSLILFDIDFFKKINDTFGHLAGDQILINLAQTIKNTSRKIDIACRYGGEEFALVLPSTPLLTAIQVAERLREVIDNTEIELMNGSRVTMTISLGVSTFAHNQKHDSLALIERADQQLYRAKNSGRNRVCADTQPLQQGSQISDDERDALFNDAPSD